MRRIARLAAGPAPWRRRLLAHGATAPAPTAQRAALSSSSSSSPPATEGDVDDEFGAIAGTAGSVEAFLGGAARAHNVFLELLVAHSRCWEERFGLGEAEWSELVTPHMVAMMQEGDPRLQHQRFGAVHEHVRRMRVVDVVAERRRVPLLLLSTDDEPAAADLADPDRARLIGYIQDYTFRCKVRAWVAAPPERYHGRQAIQFFERRVPLEYGPKERLAFAHLLASHRPVYSVFKVFDRLTQRAQGRKMRLAPNAVSMRKLGLDEDFLQQPPTVVKDMVFELTPRLNWAIDSMTVTGDIA